MNCCFLFAVRMLAMSTDTRAQDPIGRVAAQQNSPAANNLEQESSSLTNNPPSAERSDNSLGIKLIQHFGTDQIAIWTSPFRLTLADSEWMVPFGLVTGGLLATDTEFSKHLSNSAAHLKYSTDFSNCGLYSMAGLAGGFYLWGRVTQDDHKRETGILAGEAAADSFAATSALEYAFGRQSPLTNEHRGNFFQGGNSMPSDHAAIAWSVASVVAHEYPGPLTSVLIYGLASAVSVSRITAKQHFPSDVFIGSAIGWFVGQHVYRTHHDSNLDGAAWETHAESIDYDENRRPRQSMGSAFVPLDSWVYPAFERLAALGYVMTSMAGMQPWTRIECARLTEEANENLQRDQNPSARAADLQASLQREFLYEENLLNEGHNFTANVESIYARGVSISGPPLTDGYHFGQTISYDFGRPFERGTNGQAGGAFRAAAGPLAIYVRAEYQHAPSAPAQSNAVREIIAERDLVPEAPAVPVAATNRPELLDAYVALDVSNWQIAAGRQSFSWGPGPGGSLIWSDNAAPVDMVRIVNPEPFELPTFLRFLGPARVDQFIGRLAGHSFVAEPFIYGQKISFKPFSCLELGFARTTTIGGKGGNPLTYGNFFRSIFGVVSTKLNSVPGDSHSSMDWTFYVPKVRNYVVFYGELYADDDITPVENLARSAWRPGLYITRIPGVARLDFHVEGTSTESPGQVTNQGNLNYWNTIYRDGYTNRGDLIGNTVGRMGRAIQLWSTYWISPRDTVQFVYKHSSVSSDFIPGGGEWQDYGVRSEIGLKSGFYAKAQVQYEHISRFPILFKGVQRNFMTVLELGFYPGAAR
ncbi:MAG TPA: capsule assembly Wzi family protein [Candidatus Acidoferrales bacterium]|nr:capsule assembly Wzi family protein [Candidatus Acidoferrales bacterium]